MNTKLKNEDCLRIWDEEQIYKKNLLKRKQKNKMRWPLLHCFKGVGNMEKKEILRKLEMLGANIHPNTLLNWEKAGVIDQADSRTGKSANFPLRVIWQAYAAYKLKQKHFINASKDVKKIRDLAYELNEKEKYGSLIRDKNNVGAKLQFTKPEEEWSPEERLAQSWLLYAMHAQSKLKQLG